MTRNVKPSTMPLAPRAIVLAVVAALAIAACSPRIANRGNEVDPVNLAEVQPGVHDKNAVERILGSPSSVATFDSDIWYYIFKRTESIAFFTPEVIEQQIVAVKFGPVGLVEEVSQLTYEDGQEVELIDRETPTRGKELTIVRQLLGTLGFLNRDPLGGGGSVDDISR
jgi:outer membrane protein assembly factor BamE (lipoprotein component of BamABCDE complex)